MTLPSLGYYCPSRQKKWNAGAELDFLFSRSAFVLAAWVAARGAQAYRERRSLGTHASVAVLVIMYRTYVVLKSKQKNQSYGREPQGA